jgi:hypothetical protein
MLPAGILIHEKTGRFHPIIFRPAPLPGGDKLPHGVERYRSLGHHTLGFDTKEAAQRSIQAHPGLVLTSQTWQWEGEETPAITWLFQAELSKERMVPMRTLTDAEVAREVALFLETPWPYGHRCPVKNLYTGRIGTIFRALDSGRIVTHVFCTNVFRSIERTPQQLRDEGIEIQEFESVEAMVRAGWVGD